MNKIIELQKDYIFSDNIKIPKCAKFKILKETENGYKLKYLGILPCLNDYYGDIYYLAKHWFEKDKPIIKPTKVIPSNNKSLTIKQIHNKLKNSGYDKEDINDILNILENE